MAKKYKKFSNWLMAVLTLIAALVVGGYFATGAFLNFPILDLLSATVHKFVGWAFIVGGAIFSVWKFLI